MGTQVEHRRRHVRLAATVVVAVSLTVSAVVASAATLGGINPADLFGWSANDTVPLPLAFDHFDGCLGDLNGDVDVVGNTWLAPSTNWDCQPANSRADNVAQNTTADSATVDVGQSDQVVVSTFMEQTSSTKAGAGSGVSLFHDGSSFHMYVVYQRGADQITLGKVDGSGDTEIISWSWLPRSETIEFLIEIDQPDITIYADSVLVATYTMTAGELTTFGSNTRFGMESDSDKRSRWSWFQVEVLVP
ncbi:MAG: hypothetical protein O7C01_11730 [Actinobacteria bacterium]|nr:hypothetical protein [Actinomycetota bacterium]